MSFHGWEVAVHLEHDQSSRRAVIECVEFENGVRDLFLFTINLEQERFAGAVGIIRGLVSSFGLLYGSPEAVLRRIRDEMMLVFGGSDLSVVAAAVRLNPGRSDCRMIFAHFPKPYRIIFDSDAPVIRAWEEEDRSDDLCAAEYRIENSMHHISKDESLIFFPQVFHKTRGTEDQIGHYLSEMLPRARSLSALSSLVGFREQLDRQKRTSNVVADTPLLWIKRT